jgi:hypothetical protein
MNKFTKHIPNCVATSKPGPFEFTDLDDLATKLGKDKALLVYNDPHVMEVNEDESWWWVLGRVDHKIEGLREWKGPLYTVVEVDSIRGYGLDTFDPKIISDSFTARGNEFKLTGQSIKGFVGVLKDDREVLGVDK